MTTSTTLDEFLVWLPGDFAIGVSSDWDSVAQTGRTRLRIEHPTPAALLALRDAIDSALAQPEQDYPTCPQCGDLFHGQWTVCDACDEEAEDAAAQRLTFDFPHLIHTDGEHEGQPLSIEVVLGGVGDDGTVETVEDAEAFAQRAANKALADHVVVES